MGDGSFACMFVGMFEKKEKEEKRKKQNENVIIGFSWLHFAPYVAHLLFDECHTLWICQAEAGRLGSFGFGQKFYNGPDLPNMPMRF